MDMVLLNSNPMKKNMKKIYTWIALTYIYIYGKIQNSDFCKTNSGNDSHHLGVFQSLKFKI